MKNVVIHRTDKKAVGSSGSGEDSNIKRSSPSIHWCFTLNNYSKEAAGSIVETCVKEKCKYVFQEEIGEICKTPHLQGYIRFNSKKRPMSVFNWTDKMIWAKCRKHLRASIAYCSLETKRIENGAVFSQHTVTYSTKDTRE